MKELAKALAKAQPQIKSALKDTEGQIGSSRKYKYADLAAVWDACKEALSTNEIAVIQKPDFDAAGMWLETMLLHSSGESITGRYPILPTQNTPQAYGSAITYARRYALAAMVGVVADEDDDGNAASVPRPDKREKPVEPEAPKDEIAKAFVSKAIREIGACKTRTDLETWVSAWAKNTAKLAEKNPEQHKILIAAIDAQRASYKDAAE